MASGIFVILDDIATLFDDAAVLSKIAAKKTAGLLGDDLAVNAEKAVGFSAARELPVIWAITKGSFVNKLIILPLAFLLSAYLPWLLVPILLIGGAYLSYEGAEKILEWLIPHQSHAQRDVPASHVEATPEALVKLEKSKIKAAVRTDFILSLEIIIIALETTLNQPLSMRIIVVSFIALLATVGVYGLVALLVRMDDTGAWLIARAETLSGWLAGLTRSTGRGLVAALPKIIRLLIIIGTLAMLLVGGGMFVHNIEQVHHWLAWLPAILGELLAGLVVGVILVAVIQLTKKISGAARSAVG